ncbi:MAG: MFS transporter [Bacteroidota bacterium]
MTGSTIVHETLPATRGQIFSWSLFDFGNTAFYVIILTVGYPIYFRTIVTGSDPQSDLLWGLSFSISMLCAALLSPVLGAIADSGAGKKRFLFLFTALCIGSTIGLFFVEAGMIIPGMLLVILANIGFEAGLVFYDAFLPEITTERSYGRVSGYGFAMGYIGSLVTLAVSFPFLQGGFDPENAANVRTTFLIAAAFFTLFAAPIFLLVPDRLRRERLGFEVIPIGFRRIRNTMKDFSRYRNVGNFLLSYFVYIDAVNTIIVFSTIFAYESLKMEAAEIVLFFAIVQTTAILGSSSFGILADKFGHKKILNFSLLLWLTITVMAYLTESKTVFYLLGILAGVAMGSSQSTSRSLFSLIIPVEKKTEFFGFYSFFGKASAIVGPAMFGFISSNFDQRVAILSVGALLLIGILLLMRVQEPPVSMQTLE